MSVITYDRTGTTSLLDSSVQHVADPLPTGTEWLEALISTGLRYAVPRMTGGADLWDGAVTVKTLALALQKHARMLEAYAEMTAEEQAAVWADEGMAEMRRAVQTASAVRPPS